MKIKKFISFFMMVVCTTYLSGRDVKQRKIEEPKKLDSVEEVKKAEPLVDKFSENRDLMPKEEAMAFEKDKMPDLRDKAQIEKEFIPQERMTHATRAQNLGIIERELQSADKYMDSFRM